MIQAHRLDAVGLLCSCDKIVPGMLMATARLDLPAIMVVGGPMAGGCDFDGRPSDITSLTEGLAMLSDGKITEEDYHRLEDCAGPKIHQRLPGPLRPPGRVGGQGRHHPPPL